MFSKQPCLDSGRTKKQKVLTPQALTAKPAICFTEIVYITVVLSYVSASDCSLNRLNLWLFFRWFPHGNSAACKKLPDWITQKCLVYSLSFVHL